MNIHRHRVQSRHEGNAQYNHPYAQANDAESNRTVFTKIRKVNELSAAGITVHFPISINSSRYPGEGELSHEKYSRDNSGKCRADVLQPMGGGCGVNILNFV